MTSFYLFIYLFIYSPAFLDTGLPRGNVHERDSGPMGGAICCVLGPRLPLGRALERLTIGVGTTSRVGEIKPSSKVESVVIFHYLPTRSVTTLATRVKQDPKKSARRKVREKHGR